MALSTQQRLALMRASAPHQPSSLATAWTPTPHGVSNRRVTIDAGMAKITVWNATTAPVMVSLNGDAAVSVEPGTGTESTAYAAGTSVPVDIDGVVVDVATPEDSYTTCLQSTMASHLLLRSLLLPSMTDLIELLAPATPTDVVVPDVVGQAEADASSAIHRPWIGPKHDRGSG